MSENIKTIAILYICTGKYVVFWEEFYKSFEQKFITSCKKDYYVFTDADNIYGEENARVHRVYQENLGWPGNTLFRYKIFLTKKNELLKYDYLYFMNANIICNDFVGEDFLPERDNLLFVQHPGYFSAPIFLFPYERNKKSAAYIPYFKGNTYICGGVNGGGSKAFIDMCEEINIRTEEDYAKNIIAKWHDESQINKFILNCAGYKIFNPGYCYPEGWNLPFEKKLVVRDKSSYFDVDLVKDSENKIRKTPLFEKVLAMIWKIKRKIIS